MPSLNWVGKEAVINHDKEVPFKLLKKVKSVSVGENSQNLIIHGDNLEALKALMPYYGGKIKCIYIDPPYNTGNEKWIYNDNVNSPKIKKWLGKVVGGESEDLCRHDKWLCMMYPRLKLLRDLLSDDGIIFISIDDNEQANLKILCEELFGEANVEEYIWNVKDESEGAMPKTPKNTVRKEHEYLLVCLKDKNLIKFKKYNDFVYINSGVEWSNPDNDSRGDWMSGNFSRGASDANPGSKYFTIETPTGRKYSRNWSVSEEEFKNLAKDGRIYFSKNGDGVPRIKIFKNEAREVVQSSIFSNLKSSATGKKELLELLGECNFDHPKPTHLIKRILKIISEKDSFVLDSFAGSGTTGHAVLDLNKEDDGNRKFILIELENNVAKDITAERVKRAIKKYGYKDGFEYCELDKPLFNEEGQIEEECSFEQLATYIYFTETNTNLDKKLISGHSIGEYSDVKYYLLFREKGKNILSKDFLKNIAKNNGKKVIYADKCLIDDKILEQYNIQFKQIPYEVKVY